MAPALRQSADWDWYTPDTGNGNPPRDGLPDCLYLPHALGILELPLTVGIGPDRKAPFVQQSMMTAAEQKCIFEAGLPPSAQCTT